MFFLVTQYADNTIRFQTKGKKLYSIRRIISNIGWNAAGGVLSSIIVFIGSIFVARNLSIQSYGILQLAITYFIFLQQLETLAHPNVVRIEILRSKKNPIEVVKATGLIIFALYSISTILLAILYFFYDKDLILYLAIMSIGQLFRLNAGLIYMLDAFLEAKKSQLSNLLGTIIGNTYRAITSFNGSVLLQTPSIAITNLGTLVLSLSLSNVKLRDLLPRNKSHLKIAITIFKQSIPMIVVGLLTTAIYKIDILLLGHFNQTSEISYYSNTVKFTEPWSFLAISIINSMLPSIISSKKVSISKYYRNIRYMFMTLLIASVLISICTTIFADFLVSSTYGPQYAYSGNLLKYRIWSNIFLFFMLGQQIWEINENLKSQLVLKLFAGAILNISLNLILIPKMGSLACVLSTLATYSSVALWFNFFHKKTRFINKQMLVSLKSLPQALKIIRTQLQKN